MRALFPLLGAQAPQRQEELAREGGGRKAQGSERGEMSKKHVPARKCSLKCLNCFLVLQQVNHGRPQVDSIHFNTLDHVKHSQKKLCILWIESARLHDLLLNHRRFKDIPGKDGGCQLPKKRKGKDLFIIPQPKERLDPLDSDLPQTSDFRRAKADVSKVACRPQHAGVNS